MAFLRPFIDYLKSQNKQPSNFSKSNFSYGQREKIKSFEASLPAEIKSKIVINNITPPNFAMFWNFYQGFPEIQNAVGVVANRVAGLGGSWQDKDGNIIKNLEDKLNYFDTIKEFVIHLLVSGQTLIDLNNEKIEFVSNHRVVMWQGDGSSLAGFSYMNEDQEYTTVSQNFKIYKDPNINSKYFGKSPFNSFYEEVNTKFLDNQNYKKFLENNSFPGTFFKLKEGLSTSEQGEVLKMIEELSKPEGMYKGLADDKIEEIIQIKQEVSNRLTVEEKNRFERLVYNAVRYPVQFIIPLGGLGLGEQTTFLLNMKDEIIGPLQTKVAQFINETQIRGDKAVWVPNPMDTTTKNEIMKTGIDSWNSGLMTSYEVKTKYLGYKDKDTNEDDHRYKLQSKDVIIPEGKMFEPVQSKTFEIDEPESKSFDKIKSVPKIDLKQNIVDKKDIEQILKGTNRDYSKVELLFDTTQAKTFKRELKNAFYEQIGQINYQEIFRILQTEKIKSDQGLENRLINYLQDVLPTLSQVVDINALAKFISFGTQFGRQDAINNLTELDLVPTENERTFIGAELADWTKTRTQNLLGFNNATPETPLDPSLEQGLDNHTYKLISSTILTIWGSGQEISRQLLSQMKTQINTVFNDRVSRILQNETSRAINTGFITTIDFIQKKEKIRLAYVWLATISKDPRVDHLALVGRELLVSESQGGFSGEWPGMKPNCKCGLKIIKI